MSLVALADRHARLHYAPTDPAPASFSNVVSPEPSAGDPSKYIAKIMTFVPAEVVSLYLLCAAWASPNAHGLVVAWVLFGVCTLLSPLGVWAIDYGKFRKLSSEDTTQAHYQFPRFESAAALVAFIVWAAAMPASVFSTLPFFQTWMGTLSVAVVTVVLTMLDGVVGKSTT